MALFLSKLGWSLQEYWGQFVGLDRPITCNLQPTMNGWFGDGALTSSPMPKSVSLLLKGKNSTVDGVRIAYLLLVGLLDIYSG